MSTPDAPVMDRVSAFRQKMLELEKLKKEIDRDFRGAIDELLGARKRFDGDQLRELREFQGKQLVARRDFMKQNSADLRQLGYDPPENKSEESPQGNGHNEPTPTDPFAPIFPSKLTKPTSRGKSMEDQRFDRAEYQRQYRAKRISEGKLFPSEMLPKHKRSGPVPGGNTYAESRCSICELRGHDGRAHRGQEPKRPFTTAELREHGLSTGEN